MRVVFWLVEGTWEGLVEAGAAVVPPGAEVSLLHVTPTDVAGLPGAAAGALLGRMPHVSQLAYEEAADQAATEILAAAAQRLGHSDVKLLNRHGPLEREVLAALAEAGAHLVVVARDGDRSRLGPHSLGHATRFVVDHAPCSVLLVWPEEPPAVGSAPPEHDHGPPAAPPGPEPPHGRPPPAHRPKKHRPHWP